MDIKPANQKKKLIYPLATAAVIGSAVLSSCQQQQRLGGEPLQAMGGVIVIEPTKGETMSEEELLDLLATDGLLVKRPILVTAEGKVVPGFKAETWSAALGK